MTPYELFCEIKDQCCDGKSYLEHYEETIILNDKFTYTSTDTGDRITAPIRFIIQLYDGKVKVGSKIGLDSKYYGNYSLTDILSSDTINKRLRTKIIFNLDCFE